MTRPPSPDPVSDSDILHIVLVEEEDGDAKTVNQAFAKAQIGQILRLRYGIDALHDLCGRGATRPPGTHARLKDIDMPRMPGLERIAEPRRDPVLAAAMVSGMTTSNDERDKLAAYRLNIASHILKTSAGSGFPDLVSRLQNLCHVIELPVMTMAVPSGGLPGHGG